MRRARKCSDTLCTVSFLYTPAVFVILNIINSEIRVNANVFACDVDYDIML